MDGVGSFELDACYVWFSYPPSGREKSLCCRLGGGGGHMIYNAHRMVWLWTSYSRALMPAGSLGHLRAWGLSRGKLVSSHSPANERVSERVGDGSSSLPLCCWGFLARPFSLKLCSSGDTLMRCITIPSQFSRMQTDRQSSRVFMCDP